MSRLKNLFSATDMTVGVPWKKIVAFTVPMLVGNVAQQLYNTVDSIVVGRYVGDNALASVGSAGPLVNLLLVLLFGVATGAGIMVAQYFGAKSREDLSFTIGNCITVSLVITAIMMAVGPMITMPLLSLIGTPLSIIEWCRGYMMIMFLGCIGMVFYNVLSGVLRGLGDSLSALLFLLVATVLNVILDLVFVAGFKMGVPGVALATVLAQGVSAVLCLLKLIRMKENFDLTARYLSPKKQYVQMIIRLGLPSGLTQAIFSVAMIVVQSLTNTFGEMFIAANVMIMRVDGFAMMPVFSFGNAMTTYIGQNVGAKARDRIHTGARHGLIMAVGTTCVLTVLILILAPFLMGLFTKTEALINLAVRMMRILAPGYIAMAITQSLSGVMRGAGDTLTPMWLSLITTVIIRIPLAYAISFMTRTPELPTGNSICIYASLLISWLMGAILTSILYRTGRWKRKLNW